MAQQTVGRSDRAMTHRVQRDRLAFTEIDIRKAPGISPGFTIRNLSPDINIVYGPNASGKSTTARAIQALIWPHPSSLRGHALGAAFDLEGAHWTIDADFGRVHRTRDGQPAEPPLLTPIDDRGRYTLGLPDLLASEITPGARPPKGDAPLDEVGQLRMSVKQLEHALAARVIVEQAIGVLTERQRSSPRQAFERLRKVARSRGRKVHDLSKEIVMSATDPSVPLPPELAGRR